MGWLLFRAAAILQLAKKTIIATLGAVGLKTLAFYPPNYNLFDQNFGFTLKSFSRTV